MSSIPIKPDAILNRFTRDIESLFGKEVVSVILFGSAATNEYIPKKSDINFLVVLTPKGIEQIGKVTTFVKRWHKRRISLPLFLTKEYIQASLDSFPIEFFNMRMAYRLLDGEDILKDVRIKKEDLRLQCERELKSDLLRLRQGYIQTEGKAKALQRLMRESIVAFTSIFKALLYLSGEDIPETKQEVILASCRKFGLDEGLFSLLISLRVAGARVSRDRLEENLQRYIAQIETLSEAIDRMKIVKMK